MPADILCQAPRRLEIEAILRHVLCQLLSLHRREFTRQRRVKRLSQNAWDFLSEAVIVCFWFYLIVRSKNGNLVAHQHLSFLNISCFCHNWVLINPISDCREPTVNRVLHTAAQIVTLGRGAVGRLLVAIKVNGVRMGQVAGDSLTLVGPRLKTVEYFSDWPLLHVRALDEGLTKYAFQLDGLAHVVNTSEVLHLGDHGVCLADLVQPSPIAVLILAAALVRDLLEVACRDVFRLLDYLVHAAIGVLQALMWTNRWEAITRPVQRIFVAQLQSSLIKALSKHLADFVFFQNLSIQALQL